MKLTEAQAAEAINNSNLTQPGRMTLMLHWRENRPGARFVVWNLWRRMGK